MGMPTSAQMPTEWLDQLIAGNECIDINSRASLECNAMLENPIILAALTCFLLGLVLSGLARVLSGSTIASAVLPIIFLASYVLTYQQVPEFPPIGATNKIFYIALAAALIGFALDLLSQTQITANSSR